MGNATGEGWIGGSGATVWDQNRENTVLVSSTNLYFNLKDPSRYYDPSKEKLIGRQVEACRDSNHVLRDAQACQEIQSDPTEFDHTHPKAFHFSGTKRVTEIAHLYIQNESGSPGWYTDVYGMNIQKTADPENGITYQQRIVPPTAGGYVRVEVKGHDSLTDRTDYSDFGTNGVHAPN